MILDAAKLKLRMSNTAYDTEFVDLIDEAKADMKQAGILETKIVETDSLIARAIKTYCKANFGLNNPDSEKLQASYEAIRNHLSMSLDYAYYKVTIAAITQGEVTFNGEIKQTNSAGVVVFYSKAKNHVECKIDGVMSYIDIIADITIGA